MSQQFIRQLKDIQLGLDPNSFSNGRRTDAGTQVEYDSNHIVFLSVDGQTSGTRVDWDSSQWARVDWDSNQSIFSVILCGKKFRVSQILEHGN